MIFSLAISVQDRVAAIADTSIFIQIVESLSLQFFKDPLFVTVKTLIEFTIDSVNNMCRPDTLPTTHRLPYSIYTRN